MLVGTVRLCLAGQRHLPWSFSTTSLPVSSSSSSNKIQSTLKRLIDAKRYAEALNLYQQSSQFLNHYDSTLALKACAKLRDYAAGSRVHQQLSAQTLQNPFIQTALIHFYSKQHFVTIFRHAYLLASQCNVDVLTKRKRSSHRSRIKRFICTARCSKVDRLFIAMLQPPIIRLCFQQKVGASA